MMNYLITILVVGVFLIFIYWLVTKRKKSDSKTPYLDALHLLLDGKRDEALEKLKKTVWEDTDNINAYIKLGDIFRENGFPIRASKIHRNLLLRTTLTDQETEQTIYHLVLDYRAADMIDKAVEMAERLIQKDKKNIEIGKLLLELYEDKADWDKAFFMRQGINKWIKRSDHNILALYKTFAGRELTQKGSEHQGRIRFREAVKLEKECVPAYIGLGDSYVREGRHEDALKVWKEFASKIPGQAHLILDRLNDVLFTLGRYSELEGICEQIIKTRPVNPGAFFKLIDIYEKQGKMQEALDLSRQVYEANPESQRGRFTYVRFLRQTGQSNKALETSLGILKQETEKSEVCRCRQCGYEEKEMFWRCPKCRRWNPFLTEK
jgi:lipopolysaccharide biosynthesis regulator YciM